METVRIGRTRNITSVLSYTILYHPEIDVILNHLRVKTVSWIVFNLLESS